MSTFFRMIIALALCMSVPGRLGAQEAEGRKGNFFQQVMRPVRWIGANWNAKDSTYCYDTFYNWAGQIQNNTSQEFLRLETPEGLNVSMRSKRSNKIGPYFGYQWLFFGNTFDFLAHSEGKRRSEFTLSVNSQLFNIDLIRRRTGGDFRITKFDIYEDDMTQIASDVKIGNDVTYDLTGANVNMFLNHRKFSNPAGYSNGAIQIKSAGSPIVGLGFTQQTIRDSFMDRISDKFYDKDSPLYNFIMDRTLEGLIDMQRMPNYIRINDLHAQLGYAYNLVLSRRLLLSGTAIVMPGVKFCNYRSDGSTWYRLQSMHRNDPALGGWIAEMERERFKDIFNSSTEEEARRYLDAFYEDAMGPMSYKANAFNLNSSFRASLTYNHNRWRAGFVAKLSNYYYGKSVNSQPLKVNNTYYDVSLYVGYCFGRKKEFRYDGEKRNQYIHAALSEKDKLEVSDVNPKGNLGASAPSLRKYVKYHTDRMKLNVEGCDLVRGEDGNFGTFTLSDGFVTEGMDPGNRMSPGTVIPVAADGRMEFLAGHKMSYRTGNWWKSHLGHLQTNRQTYPDLLHYALKGRLELNLRGKVFGTRKPVRLVVDNFYICQGKDGSSFNEFGCSDMRRRSTYSLTGETHIVGSNHKFRLFLEEGYKVNEIDVYVSRMKPRNSQWMKSCRDDVCLSNLCIPGTHDAGASTVPESSIYWSAHTQNFPVIEQTLDGIRCFDIRLKEDMNYGHTFKCYENFEETLDEWEEFLRENPSECIIAMIGSDEGSKWSDRMKENFGRLLSKYRSRFVEEFDGTTHLGDVRGKILVIRRQEACPFGKLLQFEDNATFENNGFCVADEYKQFKTYKKFASVTRHLREAYEEDDPSKWYITFCSISWSPRRHNPYQYSNGANHIRKPMNRSLFEEIELKDYTEFGIVMLDFYNDHGDFPNLVDAIIEANYAEE